MALTALAACGLLGCSSGQLDVASILLGQDEREHHSPFETAEPEASRTFFSGYDTPALFGSPPPIPAPVERAIGSVRDRLAQNGQGELEVRVADCSDLNAFSTIDGAIYICRGAVLNAGSQDTLAFLIGHELGHIRMGHTSGLRVIERSQRRAQWVGDASAWVIGGLAFGGTLYLLFDESEELSTQIEHWVGVDTPEEDDNNDIDSGVRWLLLAAGFGAAVGGHDFSYSLSERVRVAGQRMAARAYVLRSPEDELNADDYAMRLIFSSGYSPLGADYALSTMGGRAIALDNATGSARAAFGGLGTETAGAEAWQYILLGSVHPAAEVRRARIQRQIADSSDEGAALDLCDSGDEQEAAQCQAWIVAGRSLPAASQRLIAIAQNVAAGADEAVERDCASLFGVLSRAQAALGLDREVARLAIDASLVCPGQRWSALALPVAETIGAGGYNYLRELATALIVTNHAGEAYAVADRLSAKASNNAVAYADFARWSASLGLHDLAGRSLAACSSGSRHYISADSGAFCREILDAAMADAPSHTSAIFGEGMSMRQRLVAVWHVQYLRDVLNALESDSQRVRLLAAALRLHRNFEVEQDSARWCFRRNEFSAGVVILAGDDPLIPWRGGDHSCLNGTILDRAPVH